MNQIASNLAAVRERIAAAAGAAGRDSGSVRLVAVSKTFPAEAVRTAYEAGQRDFGENKVQEASSKIDRHGLSGVGAKFRGVSPYAGSSASAR